MLPGRSLTDYSHWQRYKFYVRKKRLIVPPSQLVERLRETSSPTLQGASAVEDAQT